MKEKMITLLFLTFAFVSYAQTEEFVCGFNEELDLDQALINSLQVDPCSYSTDPAVLYAMPPIVLNVYFWQVNKFNGQFGGDPNQNVTEDEVLLAIANLNIGA